MRVCVCVCVCVWSVYLGSKSPAAGNVAVCQDLLIGVWGRDYEGWETYIHTKQDEGRHTERERVHLQTPDVFSSCLFFSFVLLRHLASAFIQSASPYQCVQTFLALVAPLGMQHQPPLTTATLAEAVPCSASWAMQDHTLLSSSLALILCTRSCKLSQ